MEWFVPYLYFPRNGTCFLKVVTPFGILSLTQPEFYGIFIAIAIIMVTIAILRVAQHAKREQAEDELAEEIANPKKTAKPVTKLAQKRTSTNQSALQENLARNGENSYYYAHKIREIDNTQTVKKTMITQYGWSDENKSISIYVTHEDVPLMEDEHIKIDWSETSLALDLTLNTEKGDIRSLVIPTLFGRIQEVTWKRKQNTIVFTLKKDDDTKWKSLNGAAKKMDDHVKYDESLYD